YERQRKEWMKIPLSRRKKLEEGQQLAKMKVNEEFGKKCLKVWLELRSLIRQIIEEDYCSGSITLLSETRISLLQNSILWNLEEETKKAIALRRQRDGRCACACGCREAAMLPEDICHYCLEYHENFREGFQRFPK
ncbi:hypothetical protein MUP38_01180, partial [Candidatus Bathyarchaeota archaeon]|nr:hypothetical protein [Candidatus Bathyarchaeota archaeon]